MNDLLLSSFYRSDLSKTVSDLLKSNDNFEIYGIPEEGRPYIINALIRVANTRSALLITYSEVRAKQLYEDLIAMTGATNIYFYPEADLMLYGVNGMSNELIQSRLEIQNRLALGEKLIIVASVTALLQTLIPLDAFKKFFHKIKLGQFIERDKLIKWLVDAGYQREDIVEAKGQFAVRGDIIDFYPFMGENAYRIELFDDEVDSIRHFDFTTQRSIDKIDEVIISPVKELVYDSEIISIAVDRIEGETDKANYSDQIKNDVELIRQNVRFENIERYMPFFYPKPCTLIDFMPDDSLFIIEDEERMKERSNIVYQEFERLFKTLLMRGQALPSQVNLITSYDELKERINTKAIISLETFHQLNNKNHIKIDARKIPSFQGNMSVITDELRRWKTDNYAIIIATSSDNRGLRIQEMLQQNGIEAWFTKRSDVALMPQQIYITNMPIANGTQWPAIKLAIITDHELFGAQKRHVRSKAVKSVQKISAFSELNVGDYVVHENYGIGQYMGIKKLTVDGKSRDYLLIRYAEGDNLYVPTDRMSLVQRYIGDGTSPKLSKLGSSEWAKTKAKVRESVKEMANELVKLYASRNLVKGYAFGPDTVWQVQLEESFPYQETPDQLQAIEEIKADMESEKPMDRLLCGDVGYGKTEVALRAAFKAVMDGKQVALLVPTTVLAQQHYNTFTSRLADFPIKVDVISRFRSSQEQRDIIKRIKSGDIDIIIGTHSLLNNKIRFHDLGLLIIDEEQRFGVAHKEALKKLKANVDVLTLTATPIPRTLHMSLSGIRDISIIETPPEGRYPVQTYVMEYDEDTIKDIILKEMDRGGQIYFVYNHVNSIDIMAARLRELVPQARIAVAHGQMDNDKLENIMMDFMDGFYDILLCTTIIETGLDIPNVNTLIVYDADHFGLAQLYQLRGRVGRSTKLAYAYFTYRKDKILSEESEKRLHAITEFTEFGSGFKIALRDLEIRGAGNLLGAEQHGHMAAVGYDMYCRLLEEAIAELKGESIEEGPDTFIDLKVDAYIPTAYIPNEAQRIEIYKRIMSISDVKEGYDVEDEIEDRFGNIPESVRNLLTIMHIKLLAKKIGILSIEQKGRHVVFTLKNDKNIDLSNLVKILSSYKNKIKFSATEQLEFRFNISKEDSDNILVAIKDLLEKILDLQSVAC